MGTDFSDLLFVTLDTPMGTNIISVNETLSGVFGVVGGKIAHATHSTSSNEFSENHSYFLFLSFLFLFLF